MGRHREFPVENGHTIAPSHHAVERFLARGSREVVLWL